MKKCWNSWDTWSRPQWSSYLSLSLPGSPSSHPFPKQWLSFRIFFLRASGLYKTGSIVQGATATLNAAAASPSAVPTKSKPLRPQPLLGHLCDGYFFFFGCFLLSLGCQLQGFLQSLVHELVWDALLLLLSSSWVVLGALGKAKGFNGLHSFGVTAQL